MRSCAPHAHHKLAQKNKIGEGEGGNENIPFNVAKEKETTMVTRRKQMKTKTKEMHNGGAQWLKELFLALRKSTTKKKDLNLRSNN